MDVRTGQQIVRMAGSPLWKWNSELWALNTFFIDNDGVLQEGKFNDITVRWLPAPCTLCSQYYSISFRSSRTSMRHNCFIKGCRFLGAVPCWISGEVDLTSITRLWNFFHNIYYCREFRRLLRGSGGHLERWPTCGLQTVRTYFKQYASFWLSTFLFYSQLHVGAESRGTVRVK